MTDLKPYIYGRLYPDEQPKESDLVIVTVKNIEPELGITVTLDEYEKIEGTIFLSELTNKKRIKSLNKLCPIGQTMVAEVVQATPEYISLSRRHITQEDETLYNDYYNLSGRLQSILKKVSYKRKVPLIDLCRDISWPLYRNIEDLTTLDKRIANHPLNILLQPSLIPGLSLPKDYENFIMEDYDTLFGREMKTLQEILFIHLISYEMNGVEDIQKYLQMCLDLKTKYTETKLEVIMDECPKYQLRFTGKNKEEIDEYKEECCRILLVFKELGFMKI